MIRWRKSQEKDAALNKKTAKELENVNDIEQESLKQNGAIESNARIVEWDDGTFSFSIGDEMFDIRKEDLHNSSLFLKFDSEMAIQKSAISEKIFVKPSHKNTRHIQMFQ